MAVIGIDAPLAQVRLAGVAGSARIVKQPVPPPNCSQSPPGGDRLEFETLISDTSAALVHASPSDVTGTIETALGKIRRFFHAGRCALLAAYGEPPMLHVYAASYASGLSQVGPEIDLAALFPWAARKLLEGVPTATRRLADLPPEAAVDRTSWEALNTKSSLMVPILTGDVVTHLVTIASVTEEREWPAEYVPRLRLLGEVMVAAVQRQQALASLHHALEEVKRLRDRLERENVYLRREVAHSSGGDLVTGHSPAISQVLSLAEQVAATDSTVLLIGETGTGKERFAAYIHEVSHRRSRHMVRVNCSAIPSALIESELFGREKGAYTGALSRQIGRFELAQGSTLFLDEIGDLPLEVQVKLLRVLQERTLERLGSPTPIGVDVRIIAATNRDLEVAVREGGFRSDLYYRLNVFPIVVPPLRERLEDIPTLVETLVEELGGVMRKRFTSIDRASMEALKRYHWPGNVRELRNILERAMILSPGPALTVTLPHSTPDVSPAAASQPGTGQERRDLQNLEREHILRVLEETGWRIRGKNAAADILGLKPTTLEARMAKLGIHRPGAHQQS